MMDIPINRLSFAVVVGSVGLLCIAISAAQTPPPPADAARGAVIAAQGLPKGVPACAQCHAFNGSSDGSGAFPRLAGQSSY